MDEQSVRGAIWIPANLLEILPDQTANVELCSQHTADMITMALREPGYNAGLIDLEGLEKLGIKGDQAHLGKLSVAAGHDMIQFGASISPQPRITYGGGPQNRGPPVKIAAWNLANVKFAAPKNVAALHVLSGPSALFRGFVDVFAQEMAMTLGDLGIKILTDRSYNQEVGRGSISEELLAWFPTTKQGDCSVMVLKERSEDAYAAVKRAGDITFGQHTLCVVGTKINRKVGQLLNNGPDKRNYQQYLANLSLKVNMKMQGDNHHVDFQALGSLKSKTIVLGAVSRIVTSFLCLLTDVSRM
jgi:eukaryotic translation initiation factor 2C